MDTITTWNPAAGGIMADHMSSKVGASIEQNRMTEITDLIAVVPDVIEHNHMTDDQLMNLVRQNDSQALETLYDRHVRGCFGLAMKIVHDPSVAEEVVQDVFMKLWSQPEKFTPDRGKFSGWLLTLVHNRAVDKLRRAQAGANGNSIPLESTTEAGVQLVDIIPDAGSTPYDDAWRNERGGIVRDVLSKLPERQREAISLAYFGGLTQKEIAESLNEPLGTIKTRTRAALQQLRRLLDAQGLVGDLR